MQADVNTIQPNTSLRKEQTSKNNDEELANQIMKVLEGQSNMEHILAEMCFTTNYNGIRAVAIMAQYALRLGIIDPKVYKAIADTTCIANKAMQEHNIRTEHFDYFQIMNEHIINEITKAKDEWHQICICTRCNYRGPSKYGNVCPQCGFCTDDD